jgi:hypothetical protein
VLITLLASFRNHPEDLLRDKDTYTTVLSCILDFFQWQSRLFHEEDILDLLFDIVAAKILSDDARKKAFKEILMRAIDRSGGDPLIRQVGKHFGPELEAELIKYKCQVIEFPLDDCLPWQFDEDSED